MITFKVKKVYLPFLLMLSVPTKSIFLMKHWSILIKINEKVHVISLLLSFFLIVMFGKTEFLNAYLPST